MAWGRLAPLGAVCSMGVFRRLSHQNFTDGLDVGCRSGLGDKGSSKLWPKELEG